LFLGFAIPSDSRANPGRAACLATTFRHMEEIKIRGARTHNLKNIKLDLPRNRLIVITGLSGSGKSSLAFDTLCACSGRLWSGQ
jgi:excinuclease ABC subunit A